MYKLVGWVLLTGGCSCLLLLFACWCCCVMFVAVWRCSVPIAVACVLFGVARRRVLPLCSLFVVGGDGVCCVLFVVVCWCSLFVVGCCCRCVLLPVVVVR